MSPMNMRILLVDDEPTDSLVTRRLLRQSVLSAASVTIADSAKVAIDYLPQGFDCILLDDHMPDRRGTEILEVLREHARYTAVILLTGQGSEQTAAGALRSGADDYLSKTNLTPEQLAQTVIRTVDKLRLQQQLDEQRTELRTAHAEIQRYTSMLEQLVHEQEQQTDQQQDSDRVAADRLSRRVEHLEVLLTESRERLAVCFRVAEDVLDELKEALRPADIGEDDPSLVRAALIRAMESLSGLSKQARSNESHIKWTAVDTGEALAQVTADLWPRLLSADMRIRGDGLPVIRAPEDVPERVFRHVVEHILRLHVRGPSTIEVSSIDHGNFVRLSFAINRVHLGQITKLSTTMSGIDSASRGLTLAQSVLKQHGGELEIDADHRTNLIIHLHWPLTVD